MSKTLEGLISAVADKVGQSDDIKNELNNALVTLAINSKMRKRENVTPVSGVAELPEDCLLLRAVGWKNETLQLYPGDILPDNEIEIGTPKWYMPNNDTVVLIPATNDAVQLVYTPRPEQMKNDEDKPSLQDCDNALIAYALWQIYTNDEDEDEAMFWEDKWSKELARWMNLDSLKHKRRSRVRTNPWV